MRQPARQPNCRRGRSPVGPTSRAAGVHAGQQPGRTRCQRNRSPPIEGDAPKRPQRRRAGCRQARGTCRQPAHQAIHVGRRRTRCRAANAIGRHRARLCGGQPASQTCMPDNRREADVPGTAARQACTPDNRREIYLPGSRPRQACTSGSRRARHARRSSRPGAHAGQPASQASCRTTGVRGLRCRGGGGAVARAATGSRRAPVPGRVVASRSRRTRCRPVRTSRRRPGGPLA